MAWLWLALGNLRANRRRTGITLLSLVVGVAGLTFLWAFIDGINAQMVNNMTGYVTGDIKVHKRGFHDEQEMNIALLQQWELPETIQPLEGVAATAPRVTGHALASLADKSRVMQLMGVDPARESAVTRLDRSLVRGRYVQSGNDIVIGVGAAEALKAKPGDEIALVVQAADGSIGAERFRVVGVFETGVKRIDGQVAQIPLVAAQDLFSFWGRVTEVSVRIEDPDHLDTVVQRLRRQIPEHELEILGWPELIPSMVQMMGFHNAVTYIVIFVVFVVVTAGIINTILMSVMERGREFGVMMALGTSSARIVQLVLLETTLLALAGYALGLVLGLSITTYFAATGMDFTAYIKAMDTMPGLSGIVYPSTSPDRWAIIGIVVIAVALLAAMIPAWIASRHTPLEAMDAHRQVTNRLHRIRTEVTSNNRIVIFAQMALRSVFRNPRRSLITASATAFGLAAYLFLYAFADGFFEQMIRNSTEQLSGHVQVMAEGHDVDLSPKLRIEDVSGQLEALSGKPGVLAVSPRVVVEGMVANPSTSRPIELVGITPDLEQRVTDLANYVVEGEYTPTNGGGILIGRKLADELDARLGDKLVVTIQQGSGDLASGAFAISGIYRTGSDLFDSEFVFVHIAQARQLLAFTADQASRIAIRLTDRNESTPLTLRLNRKLADGPLVAQDWETLLPVVVQMIEMSQVDFYLILSVVFLVVAIGVMNTMVMSVMERTRELGVMLALGTRGSQLVLTILFESLYLALLGMAGGTGAGGLIVAWLNHTGMDLSAIAGSFEAIPGITDTVYPVLIFEHVWLPSLLLFVCSVLVALYPARRAARFDPVEAIRHG